MDKNNAVGLILISVLLLTYFWLFTPQQQEPITADPEQKVQSSEAEEVKELKPITQEAEPDSLVNQKLQDRYGMFAKAMQGEKKYITLENELIKINLNTAGAVITQVELKQYKTHSGEKLYLLDEQNNKIMQLIKTSRGEINLTDLYYRAEKKSFKTEKGDSLSLIFVADLAGGKSIVHTYSLAPDDYRLRYKLQLKGLAAEVEGNEWTMQWAKAMKMVEKDLEQNRAKSTINYYTAGGSFDYLSERSSDEEVESINEPVKWIAMKQNFFTSAFIADNQINKATVKTNVPNQRTDILKNAYSEMTLPLDELNNGGGSYTFFFGPNNYKLLKSIEKGFEKNIYLGWFPVSVVNKYVIINVFHILERYISNYGLIILILVLLIKLALSPLSYKSYVSMAKMKVLQPEINALKEKHDGDMTKVQQEQMQLFQKVGVNPLSGCVPMLLQMPVLFAMFYFFPSSIELRQESFLWADDLSSYDSIINLPFSIPFYGDHVSLFTILMTITTILTMRFQGNTSNLQGPMKSVMYIMPIMFLFVLNNFAAALTYYYFVANLITFGQQLVIRRMIDEDKIKQILEENKKRNANKKKSKFQARLEEAMKASKEKADSQSKKKKK